MTDPWINMVRQLAPDYDKLWDMLEKKAEIIGHLSGRILKVSNRDPLDAYNVDFDSNLDECVEWCAGELENWSGCRRISWNQWIFDQVTNAEKFLTLLTLKWK